MTIDFTTFLNTYGFSALEKDYLAEDLARNPKTLWHTSKRILLNMKYVLEGQEDRRIL